MVHFGLGTLSAQFAETLSLAMRNRFVNLQNFQRLFFRDKIVHAHDDFFFLIYGHLVAIRGFRNFPLRIAAFDRLDHTAHSVNLVDIVPRAALDLVGERFHKIRAAEWVDRVCHPGFVRDDLLRAQSDGGSKFRRQRPSFIERIRM